MSPTMMVAMTIRISRPRRPILGTGERATTSSVTPLPVPPCYALAAPPRVERSPSVLAYEVSTVHHRPVGTDCPHGRRSPRCRAASTELLRAYRRLLTVAQILQCGQRTIERADLDERQARHRVPRCLGAVGGRCEEVFRARVVCGDHLLRDAADRTHVAVVVHRSRAGDDPSAGEVGRAELVDDPEGEH